jgi:hypothetical protein
MIPWPYSTYYLVYADRMLFAYSGRIRFAIIKDIQFLDVILSQVYPT